MNARTLLSFGLLTMAPSLLLAQTPPEPPVPAIAPVPSTPGVARAPRVPSAPRPAVSVAPGPAPAAIEAVPQPAAAPKPAVAPAPVTPAAPPMAVAPPKPLGQLINVQVEVTLTDSKGAPKTVVLTVADGEMGQNRIATDVRLGADGSPYKSYSFNADARPNITGNKIRLSLNAQADIPAPDPKGTPNFISLRQSQTLILNDGDSVEIARASDPVSDRAFTLSVKVKIQR